LKAGGSGILVKAKRSGKGGSAVSAPLLEGGYTSLRELFFSVSSLLELEEVISSIMGSTIFPIISEYHYTAQGKHKL